MRLYDRIIARKFQPVHQVRKLGLNIDTADYRALCRYVMNRLTDPEPTVVLADNVAEYFYTGVGKAPADWKWARDFPRLASPWPHMFIEYKSPRFYLGEDDKTPTPWDPQHGTAFGILISSYRCTPDIFEHADSTLREWLPADAHWLQAGLVFVEANQEIYCVADVFWPLRSDGSVIADHTDSPEFCSNLFGYHLTKNEIPQEEVLDFVRDACWPATTIASLAITFIHCRNVKIIENIPPPKLVKATERRHGVTPVTYRTIEIEPIKKILATEGNAAEVGQQKALHICRGHFKDYRQHGIFGRNHGLYWWGMHTRGTLNRGLVVKDYVAPVTSR